MSFQKIDSGKEQNRLSRTVKRGSGSFDFSISSTAINEPIIQDYSGRFRCTNYYKKKCIRGTTYLPGYLDALSILGLSPPVETVQALMVYENPLFTLRPDGKTIIDHSTTGDDRDPQPGRCHLYDGTNDFSSLGDKITDGGATLSAGLWFKTTNVSSRNIFSEWATANQCWAISIGTQVRAYLSGDGTSTYFEQSVTSGLANGQWHHVAFVFDNGALTIYLDGSVAATTTTGTKPSSLSDHATHLILGASHLGTAGNYQGSTKGAFVTIDVLDATTIAALADPKTAHIFPDGCLAIYHCEGNDPTRVWDASGNGNHLTPSGITAATWLAEDADAPYSAADEVGWSERWV